MASVVASYTGVSIAAGQTQTLVILGIANLSKIRVVAAEHAGSSTDVNIRLEIQIPGGIGILASLDVLKLKPGSQVTKEYDVPPDVLQIIANAASGAGTNIIDFVTYAV